MMGRNLRTRLPVSDDELQPKWPDFNIVKENDDKAKLKNEENFNRTHGARKLPAIQTQSDVRVKLPGDKHWSNKIFLDSKLSDRQYLIRNRRFLQSCPITEENYQFRTNVINNPSTSFNTETQKKILQRENSDIPNCTRYGRVTKPVVKYQA